MAKSFRFTIYLEVTRYDSLLSNALREPKYVYIIVIKLRTIVAAESSIFIVPVLGGIKKGFKGSEYYRTILRG